MLKKIPTKYNSTSDKGVGEIRIIRNITKHNKCSLQQASSQHQIKCRGAQNNSTKATKRVQLSSLSLTIQYSLKFRL